ncbi:MAG TPA: histidine triad nucleotide-binding protein [Dissulfurispiraceae bacterium]|nr:histidine triad nucleotide-binding protein [Dissulfurispiraceae bacterium]
MQNCVFCRIVQRQRPARVVYEDDAIVAFEDINPQAPVHTLIIPKKHIPSLLDITDEDASVLGRMLQIANKIAVDKGIADKGFRIVNNCNPDGGQTIYHIHLHLLGGRQMRWPPG